MSENEAAELFNRELDVLLRDGRPPFPSHDEGLIRAAGVLAAADFSADSAIREELRARLTGKNEGVGVLALVAESVTGAAFKVVFAAACLLLLVTQVVRQPYHRPAAPETQTAAARPSREAAASVPRAPAPPRTRLAAPPRTVYASPSTARPASSPAAAHGSVFASIPMAEPRGEPLSAFPIVSAGEGSPIKTVAARKEQVPGGTDLVMETDEVVIVIERRATSYEEFFERRVI